MIETLIIFIAIGVFIYYLYLSHMKKVCCLFPDKKRSSYGIKDIVILKEYLENKFDSVELKKDPDDKTNYFYINKTFVFYPEREIRYKYACLRCMKCDISEIEKVKKDFDKWYEAQVREEERDKLADKICGRGGCV